MAYLYTRQASMFLAGGLERVKKSNVTITLDHKHSDFLTLKSMAGPPQHVEIVEHISAQESSSSLVHIDSESDLRLFLS